MSPVTFWMLNVRNRMVVSVSVVSPQGRVADIELPCSASWERITSPGKGPNSKLKLWFLLNVCHFHTIKSKHPRLGHVCIFFIARFPGYFLWWPSLWFWLLIEQTCTLSPRLWYLRVKGVLITDSYAALQTYTGSVLGRRGAWWLSICTPYRV